VPLALLDSLGFHVLADAMEPVMRNRTRKRIRRNVLLALLITVLLVVGQLLLLQFYPGVERGMFRWSMVTGYVALILLAATLSIGAWNLMTGRKNPVSSDLRRDLGIWCATFSLAHAVIGLNVHMASWKLYFVNETGGARADLFGLGNYVGVAAAVLVLVLLATSNDYSMRLLGKTRWKNIQRLNYLFFCLVGLHGLIYLVVEKRIIPYTAILGLIGASVLVVQWRGFRRRRREALA
jgi:methionine sulfoxide reductase heme-binding subunit